RVRTVVKLERNYRSYGNILDAANELIAKNSRRLGKNLRTEAGPGEPVRVHEAPSDFAEAQWFVEEAQQLHREGVPRREIALLYRSNAQSRVMESALFNAAEGFVTQEGFGKDAVALPLDEAGAGTAGIYRGEAGKAEFNTPGAEVVTSGEIVAPPRLVPDADTGEIMSPLAAFLTHAALE